MKRVSILSMAFLSALSFSAFAADVMSATDGAFFPKATKDNLLITSKPSKPRRQVTVPREDFSGSFSDGMARNGWHTRDAGNGYFENFRKVMAREELQNVQDEINAKFYESRRYRRSAEASA